MKDNALLRVENLKTYFFMRGKPVPAVDEVSFHINKGETLAIVGESGSGKSVTALSIMRLIQSPPGKIVSGQITFDGKDLAKVSQREMREIRGNKISMIFQEPMTSLNPVYRVGDQISEPLIFHQGMSKKDALVKAIEMLKIIGIPSHEKRINDYPHEMSGGMRQRVMIAMALCCNPKLLIADEPTTALDVTIQAQILDLMSDLKSKFGTSIIMITHDLAVVAEMADRIVVMYAGKVVEESNVYDLFDKPLHPYTEGLLNSIPRMDSKKEKLFVIDGVVPNLMNLPQGCAFAPRCQKRMPICEMKMPEFKEADIDKPGRHVRCWQYEAGRE